MEPTLKRYFLCTGQIVPLEKLHEHPNAHIIGHLIYLTDEGRKVTALALWEKPAPTDTVPPMMPEIVTHLIGDARNIRCRYVKTDGQVCGRMERWEIGKAAFLALMGRYGVTTMQEAEVSGGRKT